MCIRDRDGIGYLYYQNKSNSPMTETVELFEATNIRVKKPYAGKTTFTVEVPAGEERIVLVRLLEGAGYGIKRNTSFKKTQDQLKVMVKSQGKPTRRKFKGNDVNILVYQTQYNDGVVLFYDNQTENMVLEEEIEFRMSGLVIEGDEKSNSVKTRLEPGGSRLIVLKKVADDWKLEYGIKTKILEGLKKQLMIYCQTPRHKLLKCYLPNQ
eukprot:TRINITY_DN13083_c0_g1_i3.p1 TRINITY_DN13083_c0_g1~~TRINITY_DN13083_c0_g1_i3.p1  ORF type:complete len:210 (-),score=19.92 TRINITY_DN13083_c0_g1_i3:307-936(-)